MLPDLVLRAVAPRQEHELLAVVGSLRSKSGHPDSGTELSV